MNTQDLIQSITPDQLGDCLREAGYRVNRTEQGGIVQLLSATQGIGFAVRFGNLAREEGAYLDYCFSCALRIQGELPAGLAEVWNATRRFARLSRQGDFLVLEMDALVAAGISPQHLRGQLELWDHLLQEFIVYLRDFSRDSATRLPEPAAEAEPTAEAVEA
ncbi:YbjN domain-containing protein [Metapseudomonas otitidis]|uniref:YbjN domain-containing protein n=1 Tax=Metapseudomonas otitidis TaxID=319939 RepID=UPI002810E277|nr:YbjN domain-containing protein [Pseudomonas otitidis]WMR31871.1 YbjN domain-containing protein [Pseudomonas otitidis]